MPTALCAPAGAGIRARTPRPHGGLCALQGRCCQSRLRAQPRSGCGSEVAPERVWGPVSGPWLQAGGAGPAEAAPGLIEEAPSLQSPEPSGRVSAFTPCEAHLLSAAGSRRDGCCLGRTSTVAAAVGVQGAPSRGVTADGRSRQPPPPRACGVLCLPGAATQTLRGTRDRPHRSDCHTPTPAREGAAAQDPWKGRGARPSRGGQDGRDGPKNVLRGQSESSSFPRTKSPSTDGWWTAGRGSRQQPAGAGLAPAGPLTLPASPEREGARLQKEAPVNKGAGLSWGEKQVGSGAGLKSSVAWGGPSSHLQEKSVTPVTVTVAGHLWGCAAWELC